jgi:hypothetical protein
MRENKVKAKVRLNDALLEAVFDPCEEEALRIFPIAARIGGDRTPAVRHFSAREMRGMLNPFQVASKLPSSPGPGRRATRFGLSGLA